MDSILIAESESGKQAYLYLVCFPEVLLHKVCFAGVKEQLVDDSEGLVMMYDKMEDKSKKKTKKQEQFLFFIVYSTFVFQHLMHSGLRLMNTNEVLHMLYWTNNK